jgi:tetratricopeptide (TPR) repeat protein
MRTLLALVVVCIAGGAFMVWHLLPALRDQFGSPPRQPQVVVPAPVLAPAFVSQERSPMNSTAVPASDAGAPPVEVAPPVDAAVIQSAPVELLPGATQPAVGEVRWASPISEPDWTAALARQSRRVEANPDDLDARFELAVIQMRLKLWTSAIAELDRIVLARPDDVRVRLNRAQALRAAGRLADARGEWDRVLELDPQSVAARAYRGETLLDLGRWAEAEADFRAVLHAQPDDDLAALNLALALHKLARTQDALAAVEALLAQRPKHVAALKRAAALANDLASGTEAPRDANGAALEYARRALVIDAEDETMRAIFARWSKR